MPNSMPQPSPISTTLAFSSRVVWFCSVALILSISALVMTVAVVGFPGLGWAMSATGITTAAVSKTFSAVFFIVLLLNISSSLRRRGRDFELLEYSTPGAATQRSLGGRPRAVNPSTGRPGLAWPADMIADCDPDHLDSRQCGRPVSLNRPLAF